MQVLWHDLIWMCVKERPRKVQFRVVGQVWVIVICTNIHSHRRQIAGGDTLLEFQSATTSLLETKNARVRRDTGSRRGVYTCEARGGDAA